LRAYCRKAWGFNSPSLHVISVEQRDPQRSEMYVDS
jgi:hypothetical protein